MWLGLVGIIVLGVAAAGFVLFLSRVLKLPVPKWMIPVAAGGAMLTAHLMLEYGWYDRTKAAFPDRIVVVRTFTETQFMQPWTYLVPQITRLTAFDRGSILTNEQAPDLAIAEVILMARFYPTATSRQIFDCAANRRADFLSTTAFADDGRPSNAEWVALEKDDPLLRGVCAAAQSAREAKP